METHVDRANEMVKLAENQLLYDALRDAQEELGMLNTQLARVEGNVNGFIFFNESECIWSRCSN